MVRSTDAQFSWSSFQNFVPWIVAMSANPFTVIW